MHFWTTSNYNQVLRWSALAFGVVYGISHQRSISSAAKSRELNHQYEHKAQLINKAKAEFSKKTAPLESKKEGGGMLRADQ